MAVAEFSSPNPPAQRIPSRDRLRGFSIGLVLALACLTAGWWYATGIADAGHVGLHHGITDDYYSFWNPAFALLNHEDPYSLEVAEQNQRVTYGGISSETGITNNLRLVYPIAGMFPLLPLSLLPFRVADITLLLLSIAAVALSVPWIRGKWDRKTLLYTILAFASYPIIVGLQMRQPTLFFFGLIVAALALLRSDRTVAAGLLAALAAGKPQIAFPVLLPMFVWALGDWRHRRKFAITVSATSLMLFAASLFMSPGWVPRWLAALREYSTYTYPSIVVEEFGRFGTSISVLLVISLCAVLWLLRDSDLLSQCALSVAIFAVLIPSHPYNLVLLLIPALWAFDNAPQGLPLALLRIALIELWAGSILGIVLLHTRRPLAMAIGDIVSFPVLLSILAVMISAVVNGLGELRHAQPSRMQNIRPVTTSM